MDLQNTIRKEENFVFVLTGWISPGKKKKVSWKYQYEFCWIWGSIFKMIADKYRRLI